MDPFDGKGAAAPPATGEADTGSAIRSILLCVVLCAAVVLAYSNTFGVPFLFDDVAAIERNTGVHLTRVSPGDIREVLRNPAFYGNRPVSMVSFALNHIAGGLDVKGYHAVNIVIHFLAAVVLFLLFMSTLQLAGPGRSSPQAVAFAAALIWAVHPLQTQSVTYILQRMTSLASLFFLLSLLLYVRGRLAGGAWRRRLCWSGAILSALLAFGSKETAFTLPAFIFIYEAYFFQRSEPGWPLRRWPLVALFALFALLVLFLYQGPDPWATIAGKYDVRDFTMVERLLTELRVLLFYLGLLVIPHPSRLSVDHDFPLSSSLFDPPTTVLSAVVIAGLITGALLYRRRRPLLSFAVLWYFGTLAIESSVIGLEIVFEHRLYLPSVFPVLAAVCAVDGLISKVRPKTALLAAVVLVLMTWTYQRNGVWRDAATLWGDAVSKSPSLPRPHNNLGEALAGRGELERAEAHFRRALDEDQGYLAARVNLGNTLALQGEHEEAVRHYRRALKDHRGDPNLHVNLGNALAASGRMDEALDEYSAALKIDPLSVPARRSLALLLAGRGDLEGARHHFTMLAERFPRSAVDQYNLGLTLARLGRIGEAAARFEAALAVDPLMDDARANLETARKLLERLPGDGTGR